MRFLCALLHHSATKMCACRFAWSRTQYVIWQAACKYATTLCLESLLHFEFSNTLCLKSLHTTLVSLRLKCKSSQVSLNSSQAYFPPRHSGISLKQNPRLVIGIASAFVVISTQRQSMLRYEGITFIQDVEVDDLSIQLAPLICVAT